MLQGAIHDVLGKASEEAVCGVPSGVSVTVTDSVKKGHTVCVCKS